MPRTVQTAYHHGDLRRALVETALEALRTAEPDALSLREIAKTLGVTTGAPYRHFKDKEALLDAIAHDGFLALAERLAKAAAAAEGEARLRGLILAYLAFSRDEPGYYRVMFQSTSSRRHQAADRSGPADRALDMLLSAIRGAAPGLDDAAARERAIVLCSLLHGLIVLDRAGPFTRLAGAEVMDRYAVDAGLRLVR